MRPLCCALFSLACSLAGQPSTIADRILGRADGAAWDAPYITGKDGDCQPKTPSQSFGASWDWNEHCVSHNGGLIEESFFYALDASGAVRRRVEIRPDAPDGVAEALREKLTKLFGSPAHEPFLMEISIAGAGDLWSGDKLHYFLFENPPNMHVGVRGPVQLIAVDDRLLTEISKDAFVRQADVLFFPDPPSRPFLARLIGDPYTHLISAEAKTPEERQALADQISQEALGLLGIANRALFDERAMLFLAANDLITKLSGLLDPNAAGTDDLRKQLATLGVKLGGQLHDGGLEYKQDLLWKVWREFPDSQAGELAFLELQEHGWDTNPDVGCPSNPDLFHEVIDRGEAFLAKRPNTQFRKEVLFTLAVANESWWSIALAAPDDFWVSQIPYPRKSLNKRDAEGARTRAIRYYEQIVQLASESPEAASAQRRLPRLRLNLDTSQRRFFCSYD